MALYNSSIHALKKLVLSEPSAVSSFSGCDITKISKNMTMLRNGAEYCFVEVTCDYNIQYGIQAYGNEAVELRKEALKHYQHSLQKENEEQQKEGEEKGMVQRCL